MNNRIQSLGPCLEPASKASRPTPSAALLEGDVADGCTLLSPLHYEEKYSYPLIVWLHGPGEDDQSLKRWMPHISLRNYAAVAPRGTHRPVAATGFGWRQTADHVELAHVRVAAAVERAKRQLNIHRRRVFLVGAGCGGTMAMRLALASPNRFAGALSLDGAFPRGGAPLLRLIEARQLPLFIARARKSRGYSSAVACDDLRLLYAAGMSLTLKEYPGRNVCSPQVLGDVDRWIMEVLSAQDNAAVVASSRR
jgi:phospholipase/carboxylesterase